MRLKQLIVYIISFFFLFISQTVIYAAVFSVEHKISNENLHIKIIIPENHYVYNESIQIINENDIKIIPDKTPSSVKVFDKYQERNIAVIYENAVFIINKDKLKNSKRIKLTFQGCSKDTCFLPETHSINLLESNRIINPSVINTSTLKNILKNFTVEFTITGFINAEKLVQKIENKANHKPSYSDNLSSLITTKSYLVKVIIILAGGLLLNLTPCILPMIPINLAIIGAGARASSKLNGFILGTVYAAGITIAYGFLGVFSVITGKTFGTLNASPLFNGFIGLIFFFLALAMLDVITLDFSRFLSQDNKQKKNIPGIFFMGLISALLAGACVAPVVVAVLLLTAELYAAGDYKSLFLPFFLGIGMAIPWPFAGAGLSFLPKPGAWMNMVKKLFAFVIALFSLYYFYTSYSLINYRTDTSTNSSSYLFPIKDIESALYDAQNNNKAVLIDFWASWCKNCVAMDKTTFKDNKVIKVLENVIKVKFDATDIQNNPEITTILDTFSVKGLPTLVYLKPKKNPEN